MTKTSVGLFLLVCLSFCGCSKAPDPVVIAPTIPPIAPAPVPTLVVPVTESPASAAPSNERTNDEAAYLDHYEEVINLVTSAESHLKNSSEGNAQTQLSLAQAEIDSAWQKHLSNFNVPARFTTADSYLAQGLMKESSALRKLDFSATGSGGDNGTEDFVAAGELFKASATEMEKQIDQ